MKYDMLSLETVRRIWDKFQEHHAYINEKYNKFKRKDTYWSSDRERFVGRLFKKYEGRYIAFIDKIVVGYIVKNLSFVCDPKSVYSNKYYKSWSVQGDPIFNVQKLYLKVLGFKAVNEKYGCGESMWRNGLKARISASESVTSVSRTTKGTLRSICAAT